MGAITLRSFLLLLFVYIIEVSANIGCFANNKSVCGKNALCTMVNNRPVCSCLKDYIGNPFTECTRDKCSTNQDCTTDQLCKNGRCVNACQSVCGTNTRCTVLDHSPLCSCSPGYTGNPLMHCSKIVSDELCNPSPCGVNTNCVVLRNLPTCSCLYGHQGSPLVGCYTKCKKNEDCKEQSVCVDSKCHNLCEICGKNAECVLVRKHEPVCRCPSGYSGNPLWGCYPECTQQSDCQNLCKDFCGTNAECQLRNGTTPVCSCPKGMTGDPFIKCVPHATRNLCERDPCGIKAECHSGYKSPVCACPAGYTGNPLTVCTPIIS